MPRTYHTFLVLAIHQHPPVRIYSTSTTFPRHTRNTDTLGKKLHWVFCVVRRLRVFPIMESTRSWALYTRRWRRSKVDYRCIPKASPYAVLEVKNIVRSDGSSIFGKSMLSTRDGASINCTGFHYYVLFFCVVVICQYTLVGVGEPSASWFRICWYVSRSI